MSKVSGMNIECYHTWKLILNDRCGVTYILAMIFSGHIT